MARQSNHSNVLLIDDEEDVLTLMKDFLTKNGYHVTLASNGVEGLAKIDQFNINIILCDIVMPEMDGIAFLRKIREKNLNIEVIMMTGQSTLDRCLESIEQGACEYLTKPFTREEIIKSLERAKENLEKKKTMLKRALEVKHCRSPKNPAPVWKDKHSKNP